MMSFTADPLRIKPRMLPRIWGRENLAAWCDGAQRPPGAIGEIWLSHPNNTTAEGEHFGALMARAPQTVLGELGRAPPTLRLVLTSEPSHPIVSERPVALWSIMESPLDSMVTIEDRQRASIRHARCRRGDLFRVSEHAGLIFGGGVTALEVRASFVANNQGSTHAAQRLAGVSGKKERIAWLRDATMSVEVWTLPELSFLEPDGETCHVMMALSPGVSVDGQNLSRGECIFLPAEGRRLGLSGRGAQVLVAYPDLAPTKIWERSPPLDPARAARAHYGAVALVPADASAFGIAPRLAA
ncbi:MAG TPA: hypothetical protein VG735_04615 [Caulobacterales bacterium]|nr:hypothetical protein [Caulobacterales bacterium]